MNVFVLSRELDDFPLGFAGKQAEKRNRRGYFAARNRVASKSILKPGPIVPLENWELSSEDPKGIRVLLLLPRIGAWWFAQIDSKGEANKKNRYRLHTILEPIRAVPPRRNRTHKKNEHKKTCPVFALLS